MRTPLSAITRPQIMKAMARNLELVGQVREARTPKMMTVERPWMKITMIKLQNFHRMEVYIRHSRLLHKVMARNHS